MDIALWKKANEIFTDLVHLPLKEAMEKLNTIENMQVEVKQLVITLINSGNQSSQYFKQQVGSEYELESMVSHQWKSGDNIGDYELIDEIGTGGMSQVFSGKRINSDVQKLVAIKIFSPNVASVKLREHFIAEQRILSGLSHPNIVAMLHGETTENNESFLVMELLENALAIDEYVTKQNLSIQAAIQMIVKVADALAYAHSNLIIHRDVKPTNIMVTTDGQIKVVDFGIAKLIRKDINHDKTTIMALTPSYASPEQINAGNITISTDIFSLAAVCVALIIGKSPLPQDRLIKSCEKDEEHLWTVFKSMPVDKDLKNILNQALQQQPDKRYNNMYKFAEDLQAWLNNKPVSATPDSWAYRLSKFAIRRRALFASIVTLVVTMTLAIIALSWQYNKTRIESLKAQQVKQFMLDSFNVTDPNVSQGVEISAKDLLKVAGDKLDDNQQLDAEIKFELYQTLGIAYGQLGFVKKGIDFLKKSLQIKPQDSKSTSYLSQYFLVSGQQPQLQELLNNTNEESFSEAKDKIRIYRVKTRKLAQNGDYKQALAIMDKLKVMSQDDIGIMQNNRLLAEIYYLMSDNDKAIETLELIQAQSQLKPTNTLSLGINNDLMRYYNSKGDYDSALAISQKIISQLRLILGDKHPELGGSLSQLSSIYRLKGDLKNAALAAEESYQIYVQLYGENSVSVAEILSKLGMLSYLNVDKLKAKEQFSKAISIREKIFPKDHLDTLKAKANYAGFLTATGDRKQALELLQQVYAVQLEKLGPTHLSTLMTQQHLARTFAAVGQFDAAIKHAELNTEYAINNYDQQNPVVQSGQYILAKIYLKAKRYADALQIFLVMEPRFKIQNNHEYADLLWNIAKIYVAQQQFDKADEYYLKSVQAYETVYSKKHIRSLRIQLVYAAFLKSQNKNEQAQKIAQSVKQIYNQENINEPRLLSMLEKLQ